MNKFYVIYQKNGWMVRKATGSTSVAWDGPFASRSIAEGKAQKMNNKEVKVESALCPKCIKKTKITYNWFRGKDGMWYHECHACENVFVTKLKI